MDVSFYGLSVVKAPAGTVPAPSLCFQANAAQEKLVLPGGRGGMEARFQTKQNIITMVDQLPQKNNPIIMFPKARYK